MSIRSVETHAHRKGAALVVLLLSIMALFAFLALSIDLGMLAVARTQCQDAADAAAMTGARTLNGTTSGGSNNNYANVSPNAIAAVTANNIMGRSLTSSQLALDIGRYTYVAANQRFEGQFPGPSSDNWSLVRATVSADVTNQLAFSRVLGYLPGNITAVATAAHRPRDVAVILDYSGSMRYASHLGGNPFRTNLSSNNPDTNVPAFGHYSDSAAALTATSFTLPFAAANYTVTTSDGRPPICADFYSNSSGTAAFSSASSGYATTPDGQNYLKTNRNAGGSYAHTAAEILNISSPTSNSRDTNWEAQGYRAYSMASSNHQYMQGPNYWGKTFWVWPPDPQNDWRKKYFRYPSSTTAMDDNARLYDSAGDWREPSSSTYSINYSAILQFIKSTGPNPFPTRLESGRILYYDAIPDSINTASWPPTNQNERFWKEYIDYVLGVAQTSSSGYTILTDGSMGVTGYGRDYNWGTVQITPQSSVHPQAYMHYGDNPKRPRLHFWFGPLTMVDFIGNTTLANSTGYQFSAWWPGTCHESPMYACKLGVRAALTDIQNNHPNDFVSLIMFSDPRSSSSDATGRFNRVRVGLGRDYSSMLESLWYPPSTIGNSAARIRPYDSDNMEVPRSMGATCYSMGLMLAYNQFSMNSALRTYNAGGASGDAGGNGRRGAQKIIIFETDGAPNTLASATLVNSGAYQNYYSIRYNSANPAGSEYPTSVNQLGDNNSTVTAQVYNLCSQLAANDTASPAGYSTSTKKLQIHCIGFGPMFDPSDSGTAARIATLNQMQTLGNVTDGMPSYKLAYGTESEIVTKLQEAFTKILQSGIQVSLIQ